MPILDYDLIYTITAYWHAEIFECTSGEITHVTPGFPDQAGAVAAAEAYLAAHDAQEATR
jgi:hypothetical protein